MPNPVEIGDLERRWRPLSERERDNAVELLSDAWAELTARVPLVEPRMAGGALDVALVVRVVAAMVLRVLKNPDDVQAERGGAYPYVRDNSVSVGDMYITDTELAMLAPPSSSGSLGVARTIQLGVPGWCSW